MTDKIEEFILRHRILISLVMLAVFIAMLPVLIYTWKLWLSITMSAPELFIPAMVLGAVTGTYIYYLIYGLKEIGIKGGKQGLGGLFK